MSTPHKHAEVIKAWADGAKIEYRPSAQFPWKAVFRPLWREDTEYRVHDPLREFKEAVAAGKTLQLQISEPDGSGASKWYDVSSRVVDGWWEQFKSDGTFGSDPRRYKLRVKPEPEAFELKIEVTGGPFAGASLRFEATGSVEDRKIRTLKLKDWTQ